METDASDHFMNFGDERWTFLFLFYRRILPTIPFYHSCPTPLCIQLQGTLLCYLRKTARSDIRYDANLHVILLLYAFITRSFLSFLPLVHATCCQHIRHVVPSLTILFIQLLLLPFLFCVL